MWKEATEITIVCVLAIQMGLVDAVGKMAHYEFRILSCPKCCCFWCTLGWSLTHAYPLVDALFVSFLSSYSALWLTLAYDYLATKYNKTYQKISDPAKTESSADAVS